MGHHFKGQKVKGQLAGAGALLWRPPAQLFENAKLFGVILQDNLSVEMHVNQLLGLDVGKCDFVRLSCLWFDADTATTVAVAAQWSTKFPCRQHRTFCLSDVKYLRDVLGRTRWYTKVCIRDVHGNGIPNGTGNSMGMGIKHRIGNGNGREWETTSVGMGITCTAMGIYSQRFYAAISLLLLLFLHSNMK